MIKGHVDAKYNGQPVYLIWPTGKDSAMVNNGSFVFKGEATPPAVGAIKFAPRGKDSLALFLSADTITVNVKGPLENGTLTGNRTTKDYLSIMGKLGPLTASIAKDVAAFQAIPAASRKPEHSAELMKKINAYSESNSKIVHEFIDQHPDSYISLYFLKKISAVTNYETIMPHLSKLSDRVRSTQLGKEFTTRVMAAKSPLVGTRAKDFAAKTPEGKELGLQDIMAKGGYTFVDFWASWCGPCRKENPTVVKAFETYGSKGFHILSVSLDTDAAKWKDAIEKDGMPWYHVSNLMGWKDPAAKLYNVRAIPHNLLIDPSGVIVATDLRGEALLAKLKQLMK